MLEHIKELYSAKGKMPEDIHDLIRKLQSSHFDLEMENKKLRNKQERLMKPVYGHEEIYRSIFKNKHAIMLIIEPESGKIIDANPAAVSFYGYSKEELIHMNIKEINSLNNKEVSSLMQKAELKEKDHFVFKHRLANGEIKDVDVYSGPIEIENKILLYSIIHDITEQKNAEDALKESEKKFSKTFYDNPAPMAISTLNAEFIDVNESYAKLTGYSRDELIGHTSIELNIITPQERERYINELESGSIQEMELELHNKSGKKIIVISKTELLKINNENQIISFVYDITHRKRAEKILKESEEKFSKAFDNNPAAMTLSDYEGRWLDVNESFIKLTGYSRNELVGHTSDELNLINTEKRNQIITKLQEKGSMSDAKYEIQTKSGEKRFVISKNEAIELGSENRFLTFIYDITERKKAEHALKNSLNQTQQLAEELEISNEELRATTDELQIANEELQYQGETLLRLNRTLRALSDSDYAMIHAEDEVKFMDEVCRIIIDDCGYSMVWIGFAVDENKTVRPVAQYGFDEGYIENLNITWDDTERGRGPTGTAIRTGSPYICRNMLTDPNFEPWREEAIKRGYASSVVVPLIVDNEKLGAISIYSTEPDSFLDEEVKLLKELANDLAFGIKNLRLQIAHEKAEKELFESEQKLRTLFEILPIGISIINDNRNVVYQNPALERILDISQKDLKNKSYEKRQYIKSDWTIMPDEEIPSVRAFEENKTIENVEIGIIKEDKSTIWTNVSATPLSFSDWRILITTVDITEHKNAEEDIKRQAALLNLSYEAIFVWGLNEGILYWNDGAERLYGYKVKETVGKLSHDLLQTKFPTEFNEFMDELVSKGTWTGELTHIAKDGKEIIIESRQQLIHDNSGFSTVLEINRDITERRKMEHELAKSEERYRLILETANSGVFLLDIENNFKYVNRRMMEILGYAAHEMLDNNLTQFTDTKGQKNIFKFMDEWKKGKNRLNEFKFIRKDGSTFWALLAASPVLDINNEYRGAIGVITDINARKGVEKALWEREKISKAMLYDMVGMVNTLVKRESEKKEIDNFDVFSKKADDEFENT